MKTPKLRIECARCGIPIVQLKNNCRLYCEACRKAVRAEASAGWYAANRQDNPKWQRKNKRKAKAWRKANADHIKTYLAAKSAPAAGNASVGEGS